QNEWEICLCDYLHWTSRSVDVLGCELDERFIQFVRQLLARTAEGWSREVTEDMRQHCWSETRAKATLANLPRRLSGRTEYCNMNGSLNCPNTPATWFVCPVRNADVRANIESRI